MKRRSVGLLALAVGMALLTNKRFPTEVAADDGSLHLCTAEAKIFDADGDKVASFNDSDAWTTHQECYAFALQTVHFRGLNADACRPGRFVVTWFKFYAPGYGYWEQIGPQAC